MRRLTWGALVVGRMYENGGARTMSSSCERTNYKFFWVFVCVRVCVCVFGGGRGLSPFSLLGSGGGAFLLGVEIRGGEQASKDPPAPRHVAVK